MHERLELERTSLPPSCAHSLTRGQTQGLARVMEKWPTVTGWKARSLGYMSKGDSVCDCEGGREGGKGGREGMGESDVVMV